MYVGNPLPLENDGSHNQLLYFGKERKRKKNELLCSARAQRLLHHSIG